MFSSFLLRPAKILWMGTAILFCCFCLSWILFVLVLGRSPSPFHPIKLLKKQEPLGPLSLSALQPSHMFVMPALEQALHLFLPPSFPGMKPCQSVLQVNTKSVVLPARVYLAFNDQGQLESRDREGPFWVDLSLSDQHTVFVQAVILTEEGETRFSFLRNVGVPPLQKGDEFPSQSALRILGDAIWRGPDVLSQFVSQGIYRNDPKNREFDQEAAQIFLPGESDIVYAQGANAGIKFGAMPAQSKADSSGCFGITQRIEIGSTLFSLSSQEFLTFQNGMWNKGSAYELPFARIRSITPQQLEWEIWDEAGFYRRMASSLSPSSFVIPKAEDLIHSLRIRSQQQMSCMLEKQCLFLKVGDWVLKEGGRWHVLHASEKDRMLAGCLSGELLIIEKIDAKQKSVQCKLFLPSRTQMVDFIVAPKWEGEKKTR
jgi:hypothetical protein